MQHNRITIGLSLVVSLFFIGTAAAQNSACWPNCIGTTEQHNGGDGDNFFDNSLLKVPTPAGAGQWIVYDPTGARLKVAEILRLIAQLQMLSRQLKDMTMNSKNGPSPWTSQLDRLVRLGQLIQYGQGLSYSLRNVDQEFSTRYPGYKPPEDWNQNYATWMQTSMDTLRGGLAALQIFPESIAWDAMRIAEISSAATSAMGRLQAIKAGVSASLEAVNQLQRLQQIAVSHQNMYAVIEGAKLNDQAAREAKARKYFEDGWRDIPMHGDCNKGPCMGDFGLHPQIYQRGNR